MKLPLIQRSFSFAIPRISVIAFSIMLFLALLSGCTGKKADTDDKNHLMVIEYVSPIRQPVFDTVSLTGTIRAEMRSTVTANIDGKVVAVYADVGDHVTKGQVLIKLETGALNAQYQQAKAQLDIARQQLAIAQKGARPEEIAQLKQQESAALTAYQTAEDNYKRQKKLFEDGVISQAVYDQSLTARDAAKAQLESIRLSLGMAQTGARPEDVQIAKLSVSSAENQLKALGATIGYATVRAPFDGIVSARKVEIAEYAGMGDPLFELLGDGQRKIVVEVPETLITQVAHADTILARVGDERRQCRIVKVHPAVNETTRMGVIEVAANNESGLIVGGYMEIEFTTKLSSDSITLPRRCVLSPDENPHVWVASDDGTVTKAPVTLGTASRQLFEIKSGLSGAEKVIITGQSLVSAEGKYEVREYKADGAEAEAAPSDTDTPPSSEAKSSDTNVPPADESGAFEKVQDEEAGGGAR